MCGRVAAYTPPPKLARALAAGIAADADDHWRPSFNIPPAKRLYACRLDHGGERLLQPFGWGLIPRWAKDPADRTLSLFDTPIFDSVRRWRSDGSLDRSAPG